MSEYKMTRPIYDQCAAHCRVVYLLYIIIVMKSVHMELVVLDNIMFAEYLFKYLRIAIIIL